MTAIERAEALLEVVGEKRPACDCAKSHKQGCPVMLWHRRQSDARILLNIKAPRTLRGYIGAVKALKEEMDIRQEGTERFSETVREIDGHRATCEAIADFECLFPEAPASAD